MEQLSLKNYVKARKPVVSIVIRGIFQCSQFRLAILTRLLASKREKPRCIHVAASFYAAAVYRMRCENRRVYRCIHVAASFYAAVYRMRCENRRVYRCG
jgi:hypothetical protein